MGGDNKGNATGDPHRISLGGCTKMDSDQSSINTDELNTGGEQ